MVDVGKLRKQMVSLEKGEDSSRREVIQALRQYVEQEWAEAPQDVVQSLIDSLLQQVHHNATAPFMQKEVATILGNMGPRSKSAVPQLVEFLQDGVPDPIREVAAAALGKIGRDAKAAVDSASKVIKEDVAKADAEEMKKKLEEAGAKVTLK